LLLVLVVLIAGFLFIRSSFFAVGSVVVEGNRYLGTEDIYQIAQIPARINIFSLSTDKIRSRLLKDLRIADATVYRKFPGTIVIRITERKPLAYAASSYGFVEMDKQGVILAALKNLKRLNVPMITGVRIENGYVGDTVSDPAVKAALTYLSLLNEESLNQISEINMSSSKQIIGYTLDAVQIRLGSSAGLAEKAKLTNDILKDIRQKNMAVAYIDLSYSSPFIKFK
jgi:cell division protein FtsQ